MAAEPLRTPFESLEWASKLLYSPGKRGRGYSGTLMLGRRKPSRGPSGQPRQQPACSLLRTCRKVHSRLRDGKKGRRARNHPYEVGWLDTGCRAFAAVKTVHGNNMWSRLSRLYVRTYEQSTAGRVQSIPSFRLTSGRAEGSTKKREF